MSVLLHIRSSKFIVNSLLALVLVGFLLSNAGNYINFWWNKPITHVGYFKGEELDVNAYARDYTQQRHTSMMGLQQRGEKMRPEYDIFFHRYAWRRFIRNKVLTPMYTPIGLAVTSEELADKTFNEETYNNSPEAKKLGLDSAFMIKAYRKMIETGAKGYLEMLEKQSREQALIEKLSILIGRTAFPSGFAHGLHQELDEPVSVDVLFVPYEAVNQEVTVTEEEVEKAYQEQPLTRYQAHPERRSITYVSFPLTPSAKDEAELREGLDKLAQRFKESRNPVHFAQRYAENQEQKSEQEPSTSEEEADKKPQVSVRWTLAHMPGLLKKKVQQGKIGDVFGPYEEQPGLFILYRLLKKSKGKKSQKGKTIYTFVRITKKLEAGSQTRDDLIQEIKDYAEGITSQEEWQARAEQKGLQVGRVTFNMKDALQLGDPKSNRPLMIWLFKAKVGELSEPIERIDLPSYLLARVTKVEPAGLPAPEARKKTLRKQLLHKKKAAIISEQLRKAQAATPTKTKKKKKKGEDKNPLDKVATAYGIQASVLKACELSFEQHRGLSGAGASREAVGAAFALEPGQMSPPIRTSQGVVILRRVPSKATRNKKTSLSKKELQEAWEKFVEKEEQHVYEMMYLLKEEQAHVEDRRCNFF